MLGNESSVPCAVSCENFFAKKFYRGFDFKEEGNTIIYCKSLASTIIFQEGISSTNLNSKKNILKKSTHGICPGYMTMTSNNTKQMWEIYTEYI